MLDILNLQCYQMQYAQFAIWKKTLALYFQFNVDTKLALNALKQKLHWLFSKNLKIEKK